MSNGFQENAKGGISFSAPLFSFGTTVPQVNSGFSFDIPLATIQAFQQSALGYSVKNSEANRGFLSNVISQGQIGVNSASQFQSARVNQLTDFSTAFQNRVLDTMQGISTDMGSTARYIAKKQAKAQSGGCYITTAVCKAEGKPDDCHELETLRKFRDEYVRVHFPELVEQYYAEAPLIVEEIERRANKGELYDHLRLGFIVPAVHAVEKGEHAKALEIYLEMVDCALDMAAMGEMA